MSMNLPNQITIARLVVSLIVFVLIPLRQFQWAMVFFLIAAATDWLDGYLARKHGLVTQLGRILDPFADKILISGAFIFLAAEPASQIAAWMAVVVVGRELLVTALRSFLEQQGADFSAQDGRQAEDGVPMRRRRTQPVCPQPGADSRIPRLGPADRSDLRGRLVGRHLHDLLRCRLHLFCSTVAQTHSHRHRQVEIMFEFAQHTLVALACVIVPASLLMWLLSLDRLFKGRPLLELVPRRPVPWSLVDLLLVGFVGFAVLSISQWFCLQQFDLPEGSWDLKDLTPGQQVNVLITFSASSLLTWLVALGVCRWRSGAQATRSGLVGRDLAA